MLTFDEQLVLPDKIIATWHGNTVLKSIAHKFNLYISDDMFSYVKLISQPTIAEALRRKDT